MSNLTHIFQAAWFQLLFLAKYTTHKTPLADPTVPFWSLMLEYSTNTHIVGCDIL